MSAMARDRRNAPPPASGRRRRTGTEETDRIRRRIHAEPDLVLTEDELRSLADEGIDPEEVREAARRVPEQPEASIHDRDTPRDHVESLVRDEDDT